MNYVIFTDSTSDLTPEECKRIGVWPEIFPQEITCYGNRVDYSDYELFYQNLDNGEYPAGQLKTSGGSYGDFVAILENIIKNTESTTTIVYVSTSPFISSTTVNIGMSAISEYQEKYPERKFVYIDSHSVSGGQAIFMHYLAKYGGEDIVTYAEELGRHCVHLFTLRDFRYTQKSGRFNIIEHIAMIAMTQLKISPWMYFPYDGKLTMNGQIFRNDKILHEWVNYFNTNRADDANYVRICYGGAAEKNRAEKLAKLLHKHANLAEDQIEVAHVGPIIASHTGSTVLAFFFKQSGDRI